MLLVYPWYTSAHMQTCSMYWYPTIGCIPVVYDVMSRTPYESFACNIYTGFAVWSGYPLISGGLAHTLSPMPIISIFPLPGDGVWSVCDRTLAHMSMATQQYLQRHHLLGSSREERNEGENVLDIRRLRTLPKLLWLRFAQFCCFESNRLTRPVCSQAPPVQLCHW